MSAPARPTAQAVSRRPGCAILAFIGAVLLLINEYPLGAVLLLFITGVYLVVDQHKAKQAVELHRIRSLQSTEITGYHAMSPGEFERAVAFLCERDGCADVRVIGGAGDLGADVIATAPDGRGIVIQCKRYGPTTKVGSPDLQRFGGTCYSVHRAHVAAIVTTSVFTRPAVNYGTAQGIRLVDNGALAGWATRTGPTPWM
ncbi:restriction endonuclease [Streptomyces sp. NPDC052301]|uniref:restriction endonuclease n=1 Tax=Streptomyces sp. NPDC052301 TaxID=3365687 RepID=UPI0037D0CC65